MTESDRPTGQANIENRRNNSFRVLSLNIVIILLTKTRFEAGAFVELKVRLITIA